jgi:hypothetical protein
MRILLIAIILLFLIFFFNGRCSLLIQCHEVSNPGIQGYGIRKEPNIMQFQLTEKKLPEQKVLKGVLESQREAILMTLIGVAKCKNKPYCFVSQNRQLELLSKYHSWNISRSTLNRRLKELEDEGYFIRIRRHKAGEDGTILFASTLYKFKAKIFMWLHRIGRTIAKIFSFYRVPRVTQYLSTKQNKVLKGDCVDVEILWKSNGRWFLKEGLRH